MKISDLPALVPVPFASNADAQYVDVVPLNPSVPGRASMEGGFPPVNFIPLASGGIPPFGQDMNGILLLVTQWARWQGSGGPVGYSSAFSAAVGGYPAGAAVSAASGLGWWVSKVDDNTSNPDSGGADWALVSIDQVYAGNPNTHVAGQQATAFSAPTLCWDSTSLSFWWCSVSGNAAAAVWVRLSALTPVEYVSGNTRNYTAADLGKVIARSNGATAMADTLPPAGTVENGWHVTIQNVGPSAIDTVTAPGGTTLNGTAGGTQQLRPNQSATITADGANGYLITQVPVPVVFSSQAIYVNSSGLYAPGVYHVDTTAGPITFQLESSGAPGDNYTIKDVGGALAANPCSIDPNGNTAEGFSGLFPLDVNWSEGITLSLNAGNWSFS